MQYELELKPFIRKVGFKYKIIYITDIKLHSSKRRPTKSVVEKIKKSSSINKPSRLYGFKIDEFKDKKNADEIVIDIIQRDSNLFNYIQEERERGYGILLRIPEGGIPIMLGDDTLEFMESKNGKRVLRGLNK